LLVFSLFLFLLAGSERAFRWKVMSGTTAERWKRIGSGDARGASCWRRCGDQVMPGKEDAGDGTKFVPVLTGMG
jgi:hypothetical protein